MLSLWIPTIACERRPPRQVVLITIDTLRADHVGTSRYGARLTPALDRLAADAVRYSDVLANASTTLTSHVSMLTGLYPWHHRVISNRHALAEAVPWLPEALRARGFATAAVVSSITLDAHTGLARGFDLYDDRFDAAEVNRANQLVKTPAETTRVTLSWLSDHARRDFFLWVHYLPPHGPYTPPEEFLRDMRRSESAQRLPIGLDNWDAGAIPRYQRLDGERDPEAYRRAYAGHVRYVDHHVGRLLDGLRELRLYDGALVIVASDHGESLGEHGWYFCHGNLVYQEQVAIPLSIKLPGAVAAGRVITTPVEGVDIAPTVLRVLGLDDVLHADGRVILPGALDGGPRPRFTQSDNAEVLAVVAGATKLVLRVSDPSLAGPSHPGRAMFALDRDPGEETPVSGEPPALLADLENQLLLRYQDIARAPRSLTPQQEDRLRALGYTR
jgi:arylsulfatase A-like enzyme